MLMHLPSPSLKNLTVKMQDQALRWGSNVRMVICAVNLVPLMGKKVGGVKGSFYRRVGKPGREFGF